MRLEALIVMVRILVARVVTCAFAGSLISAVSAGSANEHRLSDSCREAITKEDRLKSVTSRGELVLASGDRILLSGLRLPDEGPLADEAAAWLRRLEGQTLVFTQQGETDRWGRRHVDAIAGEDEPVDLALGLIAAGLAFVDSGESDALCRSDLLKAEAFPRTSRLGVWAAQPLSAVDGPALTSRNGHFTVAEGPIRSVTERRNRTYLNFVGPGEPGLSVTVMKRTWRIMLERGLTAQSLTGRAIRVRGTIEIWRGPMLDMGSPDMIELLDGEQALRR